MNSVLFTALTYFAGVGALEMFMPQLRARAFVSAHKPIVAIGLIGYCALSYQVFSLAAGFDPKNWNEYNYAKSVRMLRNVQIKQ